jgi:hypothetical protein
LSFTFLLLGRSKAEQYFGFLPFFAYINFMLGYIPLALSDTTSQIIILAYIIYSSIVYYIQFFLNKSFINSVNSFSPKNEKRGPYKPLTDSHNFKNSFVNLFKPQASYSYNKDVHSVPLFSKKLNVLSRDIHLLTNPHQTSIHPISKLIPPFSYFNLKTLQLKNKHPNSLPSTITDTEALYLTVDYSLFEKTKTTQVTLNDLYRISKLKKYPALFNFNIENNLNMAKQQR